jgi:hypothetical protein
MKKLSKFLTLELPAPTTRPAVERTIVVEDGTARRSNKAAILAERVDAPRNMAWSLDGEDGPIDETFPAVEDVLANFIDSETVSGVVNRWKLAETLRLRDTEVGYIETAPKALSFEYSANEVLFVAGEFDGVKRMCLDMWYLLAFAETMDADELAITVFSGDEYDLLLVAGGDQVAIVAGCREDGE